MTDARAREQLRQEREAFEQASRHDAAWFGLRLAVGYLGLAIMVIMFAVAMWVLIHPTAYGAGPLGAAAATMTTQALAISYGIVRAVLQQTRIVRLEPTTLASRPMASRKRAADREGWSLACPSATDTT